VNIIMFTNLAFHLGAIVVDTVDQIIDADCSTHYTMHLDSR
jgi:hypothetical protein